MSVVINDGWVGDFAPQDIWQYLEMFLLLQLEGDCYWCLWWVVHMIAPTANNDLAQNVSSAEVETLMCVTYSFKHPLNCYIHVPE